MTGALVDIPRDTIVVAPAGDKFTVQDIGSGVAVFALIQPQILLESFMQHCLRHRDQPRAAQGDTPTQELRP